MCLHDDPNADASKIYLLMVTLVECTLDIALNFCSSPYLTHVIQPSLWEHGVKKKIHKEVNIPKMELYDRISKIEKKKSFTLQDKPT